MTRATDVVNIYLHLNQYSPHGVYEMREHIDFCLTCIAKTLPIEQQVALLKDVYNLKVKEIALILDKSIGVVQHFLHDARKAMVDIFDDRCALVNKSGICFQCTEMNGLFNPKQKAREALMKIEMVRATADKEKERLFELRTKLIRSIDPLNAEDIDLHDFILHRIRTVIGEVRNPP